MSRFLPALEFDSVVVVLHSSQDMKDDQGKAIVQLPPREVHVVRVTLSAAEEEFYK
jgi:hypothetical protein